MELKNQTIVTEFILLGFSNNLGTNITLFLIFFVIYVITVIGNSLIIVIIVITSTLHKPMYFFICNLSFLDLAYLSASVPKFLADIFAHKRSISFGACTLQMNVYLFLGETECLLLALMAYDRYAAICHPLYYHVLMSWKICYKMTAMIFIMSFVMADVPSLAMPVTFCFSNRINHFMCDILAVLKLACGDLHSSELLIFSFSFITLLLPFGLIIVTYLCIISSVLKMHSVGRSKAFSTCTSHVTVVVLYFGSAMIMFFGPPSNYSSDLQKYISIFYLVITPMLNPLIYSLKNKEVKEAIIKLKEK
ncbi:olfactory receptor 5AP2-like [Rhinophrynus dorsalis]